MTPRRASAPWSGHVLTPQGWVHGEVRIDGARIARVDGSPAAADLRAPGGDALTPLLLPGFVDLHLHGGGGCDTMDGGNAVARLGTVHARHGTTSFLATTMTAPLHEVESALRGVAQALAARPRGCARVLGVHLEGPYLSTQRLGAQPDFTRIPTLGEVLALNALAPIRVLTLAPEIDGALALIPALVAAGLRVQIGHSAADYETACAALHAGAGGFTHLFNAMTPLHHRAPGVVGAALALGEHAELIADGLHVHEGALRAALRALPRLHAVSDATAAAGMPDGDYSLGRQRVRKCGNGVRLADGTLAGSSLTMDQALRNLVALGLPVAQASALTSTHAADYLGLAERGRIAPGAWADLVQLDPVTLRVQQVMVEGEEVKGVG